MLLEHSSPNIGAIGVGWNAERVTSPNSRCRVGAFQEHSHLFADSACVKPQQPSPILPAVFRLSPQSPTILQSVVGPDRSSVRPLLDNHEGGNMCIKEAACSQAGSRNPAAILPTDRFPT